MIKLIMNFNFSTRSKLAESYNAIEEFGKAREAMIILHIIEVRRKNAVKFSYE
jgi:hypothetical protein